MVPTGWGWVPPTLRADCPKETPKWAQKGKNGKVA